MKTISGKVVSTTPISLSDAAKSLTKFASSDQGASHALSFFVQQAAHSFNKLVHFHNKLTPNFTDNVQKVEEISQISHKAGVKVETLVKNEGFSNGFQENKKSKNLGKVKDQKVINNEERVDIGEREMGKSEKNEPDFGKNDGYVKMEIGGKEVKEDDGVISRDKKKKKKKNKGVGDSEVEDMKVKNVERVVIGEGQTEKSEKNEPEFVKTETGGEEVKDDDGMISRDKKKKKKNRGVGEHESEVEKVKEDLVVMEDGEGKNSKSADRDASENDGSTEQRNKKKSKKRRIVGEK